MRAENLNAKPETSPTSMRPGPVGLVNRHVLGIIALCTAAAAWSASGFFVLASSADPMTIVFWRGVSGALFLSMAMVLAGERQFIAKFRQLGTAGVAGIGLMTIAIFAFVESFRHTSVANVHIVYSGSWLFTAVIAFCTVGKKIGKTTILAGLLTIAGVAMASASELTFGAFTGNLLAIFMTLCVSATTVILREASSVPLLPFAISAALGAAFVGFLLSPGIILPLSEIGTLVGFGFTNVAVGWGLYSYGARNVESTNAAMTSALEVPLAIAITLIAGGMPVSWAEIAGGCLVTAALIWSLQTA